ncbi:MAG: glycine--tRNA ligase [Lentisphaerae bacterium]|nr:glycine--tRNA ligase [Lentisphaerota bacterium]
MNEQANVSMETLASLCKRRGFIFPGSEIYGGLNGFWDYGPLGSELKRNVREAWWRAVVQRRDDVVGVDSAIILHPRAWEASGHVGGFADPMVDCRQCRKRFRADQLCEEQGMKLGKAADGKTFILPEGVKCTACGSKDLTPPRAFNLMFKTFVGPVEDDSAVAYLRPETAQGIFVNFNNVVDTARVKVPFGIAQIGKAFRNEINPRNFTFRSREFEQMELEFFIKPGTDAEWHEYWVAERLKWYQTIGLPEGRLHRYVYPKEDLAHYASACVDVMYEFPFGTQELEGIAARGNFDLSRHQEFSGKSMEYFDQEKNERFIPHVVEPSAGVDRITLAVLCEAYREEWVPAGDTPGGVLPAEPGKPAPQGYEVRTVMKFAPCVAPIKAAVFPLLKNKPDLVAKARGIHETLKRRWNVFYDQTGAIGRRYRRQDEAGTPFGITVDFQTLEDDTVTLRDRDTMKQERVPAAELAARVAAAVEG